MSCESFADKLEKATIDTIESGTMTGDLALITTLENVNKVGSEEFIKGNFFIAFLKHSNLSLC